MAKRKARKPRREVPTADYTDAEGNVLTLRCELSSSTIAKIQKAAGKGEAASVEDDWRRRTELAFERLAVRWEIAGLPLDDQAMLLGRYRMAGTETQRWVRATIVEHVERYIPELSAG